MKRVKKSIGLVVALPVIMLLSCQKSLDKQPFTYTEAAVLSDPNLQEGLLMNVYGDVVGRWAQQFTDLYTDNFVAYSTSGLQTLLTGVGTSATLDVGAWRREEYNVIRRCNRIIELFKDATDSRGKQYRAEALVLRSYYYYMALRYGGLMIVDRTLSPSDDFKIARSSEEETYDFIIRGIEEAIPDLPDEKNLNRFTKHSANALLTSVALQGAAAVKGAKQTEYYNKVITAGKAVEAAGYVLEPVYSKLFTKVEDVMGSAESILVLQRMAPSGQQMQYSRFFATSFNLGNPKLSSNITDNPMLRLADADASAKFEAWPLGYPTQEMVDAYLFKSNGGEEKTYLNGNFLNQPASQMWADRDDRFEQSIVRDSARYFSSTLYFRGGDPGQPNYSGNARWDVVRNNNAPQPWGVSNSGYSTRKWHIEDYSVQSGGNLLYTSRYNYGEALFRLGKVLLNMSEAYYRLGNVAEAMTYMNRTRVTHGGLAPLTNAADYLKYYKIERRVELFMEDDRYWSLIRWSRAEGNQPIPELNGDLHYIDIDAKGNVRSFGVPQPGVQEVITGTRRFDVPKAYFFPIPIAEIQNNEKLIQNPGWE